ncbi:peptidase family M48-domain-containing protein [Trametes gibbosa]|nr:peptidase family M48-domain-containing protein [Trametes gibbosa]
MLRPALRATVPAAPRSLPHAPRRRLPQCARTATTTHSLTSAPLLAARCFSTDVGSASGSQRAIRTTRLAGHGYGDTHPLLLARSRPLAGRPTPGTPLLLAVGNARAFHATRRNELSPIPLLAGLLKTSTALEVARMAARIGLTFVPIILLGNMRAKKLIRIADEHKIPELVEKREHMLRKIRHSTILFHILIFVPIVIFWATIIASLERTPLTGRWRIILLSPEEEEDIAAQLAGPGWYRAVGEILSADGTPSIIPPSDWRLEWVRDTLHRLESAIPVLAREDELCKHWVDCGPDDVPLPPPAEYPLRPRPRASEYLRRFAEMTCARTCPPPPHVIAGPPYSLLVIDKPDSSNAFSYGFGPDGGGGIVVFSGFLDEVLARNRCATPEPEPEPRSWLAQLFGLAPRPRPRPAPTEQQTAELATLLAHELAHLVLSHHIETLSSGSIVWPSVLSIVTDAVRAFLFPITMLFGPFINDALAGVGKVGAGEFSQLSEYCTSQKQEVEADVVSARILAHAGFDPRDAARFWEARQDTPKTAECSPARAEATATTGSVVSEVLALPRRLMGETHPVQQVRVAKLRAELERWEAEREAARAKRDGACAKGE